jgi:hypothetical protein
VEIGVWCIGIVVLDAHESVPTREFASHIRLFAPEFEQAGEAAEFEFIWISEDEAMCEECTWDEGFVVDFHLHGLFVFVALDAEVVASGFEDDAGEFACGFLGAWVVCEFGREIGEAFTADWEGEFDTQASLDHLVADGGSKECEGRQALAHAVFEVEVDRAVGVAARFQHATRVEAVVEFGGAVGEFELLEQIGDEQAPEHAADGVA